MLNIKMTINGRPATSANIKDALEKSIFDAACKQIADKLKNIGPTADGERLQVELTRSSANNVSVSLSGPAELIEQAKAALGKKQS